MNDQLVLLEDEDPGPQSVPARSQMWPLDEHTRDIGRRGVALAREALRQAAGRAA